MNRYKKNYINISEKVFTEDDKTDDKQSLFNVGNIKMGSIVKKNKALILLDASNIAMRHGGNTKYSTKGIQIAINYFTSNGHKVLSFLPEYLFKANKDDGKSKTKVLTYNFTNIRYSLITSNILKNYLKKG